MRRAGPRCLQMSRKILTGRLVGEFQALAQAMTVVP
jgi:hypothetical protein